VVTLAELIDELQGERLGLTFVAFGDSRRVAHDTLRSRVQDLAGRFVGAGLSKGERVLLVLPDQHEFALAFFGAVCAGAVPVPVYPPFMLADEEAYLASVQRIARLGGADRLVCGPELSEFLEPLAGELALSTLDQIRACEVRGLPQIRDEDVCFLQFTSGSTAAPKGAAVTHGSLMSNVAAIGDHLDDGNSDRDRVVSWLPMYHDMGLIGMLIVPLFKRVSAWYLSPVDFVRRPTSWCDLMDEVQGTISFAPNFAYSLVARRATDEDISRWDLSRWRVAGCGAEPIRPDSLRAFAERLAQSGFSSQAFLPCYGLAEATLAVTLAPLSQGIRTLAVASEPLRNGGLARPPLGDEAAHEAVACGLPLPGHDVAVIDADGERVPDGHEGQIVTRGPSVTAGYFADADATAAAFRDGWLHTGDLGFVHDDQLYVTGREKDLMIVGGRNYHPQDVEWAAAGIEGLREGNVVAFSCDGAAAERVVLVAERRPDADSLKIARELSARVRSRLGLVVNDVMVIESGELPKTSSGKLRRRETRDRYLTGSLESAVTADAVSFVRAELAILDPEARTDRITADADLATLDLDSMTLLSLVAALEERYDGRVPEESLATVRTLREVFALVTPELVPAGGS
jgi:fatty-acyl-CoA synthase